MLDELRYRMRSLLRGAQVDRELRDEIAFHLERETENNVALGMDRGEARRRALVALGGIEPLREAHRDGRGARWFEETVADVKHAARGLRRNPALTAAALITFGLAVGANTAIFSAVDAVLLQPLPFKQPDRLVAVGENNPEFHWHMEDAAPANLLDWRARVAGFQDVMAYPGFDESGTLLNNGVPILISAKQVTGNFFSVLGIEAQIGRTFREDETWESGSDVVILSDRLWHDQFRGDPAIVGKTILFDGKPRTVVGVAPRGFDFPQRGIDLWRPVAWPKKDFAADRYRRAHWMRTVARLRPGVTVEQANAQLQAVAAQLKSEFPATNRVMDAELAPLHRFLVGDTRLPLMILLGSVGLLLLIACANVGNLLLVRAAAREREVALRIALGAGRMRLARQALAESLLLSVLGGAVGLAFGWWGTRTLGALVPRGMLRVSEFGVDWTVVWYIILIITVCGMLFGIAPAVWAGRRDPNDALKAGGRSVGPGVHVHHWGRRLAVAEVAVALLLTVGAGLLIRSYALLERVDPGFDARNVITISANLPAMRYDSTRKVLAFFDQLIGRVRALPGVMDAALVTHLPLTVPGWSSDFSIDGASAGHFSTPLLHRQITPDYFRTMRVPLLRGRGFTDADRGPPYVVVINDAFARAYFKDRNPIGQRICFDRVPDSTTTWRTIVGIVGSEHQTTPAAPPAFEAFAPIAQEPSRLTTLVARTTGQPASFGPSIRRIFSELDPRLAIIDIQTMSDVQATSMARDRFLMTLLSLFGVVGLVLAVVGVYGVVAQLARGRTREMGIRIALGAPVSSVRWLVVRHGLAVTATGLAIGGVGALVGTRALSRMLFSIAPTDPVTFTTVIATLLAASFCASWLPAARAGRVDPVTTLRDE